MENGEDIWGDDDDFFLVCTQPVSQQRIRIKEEVESPNEVEVKEEIEDETEWGPDEDDELLVTASQILEKPSGFHFQIPLGQSADAVQNQSNSTSPIMPAAFRALSLLHSREQLKKHNSSFTSEMRVAVDADVICQAFIDLEGKLIASKGENATLRRKMNTTISIQDKETTERINRQNEERRREADKKRQAEQEKEMLESQLVFERQEVSRLKFNRKFSQSCSQAVDETSSLKSPPFKFPTKRSFLSKEVPPVPKFSNQKPPATYLQEESKNLLLKLTGVNVGHSEESDERDRLSDGKEIDILGDFSLRKPMKLSDFNNDEYQWECDNEESTLNLTQTKCRVEHLEQAMMEVSDDSDSGSEASDESISDWEVELCRDPTPPVEPKSPSFTSADQVVQWVKNSDESSISDDKLNQEKECEEEKRKCVFEKLVGLTKSSAPWSQIFAFINDNVEHRFRQCQSLVDDVVHIAPKAISYLEPFSLSREIQFLREEARLWKWYLHQVDIKNREAENKKVRSPSLKPTKCNPGPSMNLLKSLSELPIESMSSWAVLSHVKVQLEHLIWISDSKNEWRIYEKHNLEAFVKLLMWTSELWSYVMLEENNPEVVRFHLPNWQSELRSWTGILLEIGNADFLGFKKFRRLILSLVLDIFSKIMKSGYFHVTKDNYKLLSDILKTASRQCAVTTCKSLLNVCTILKYGFNDNQFINMLCGRVNESLCLMDIISTGFISAFAIESNPNLKASLFVEYVSTLNLLIHKTPLHYTSRLSRANLKLRKNNQNVGFYQNEEPQAKEYENVAWLHPNNWEDPEKLKGLCQCRKILCANVIAMFIDIIQLWRDAISVAENDLAALEKKHKRDDDEFLEQHSLDNGREVIRLNKLELEQKKNTYTKQLEQCKMNCGRVNLTDLDENEQEKLDEYIFMYEKYKQELKEYKEKKSNLILKRRDYQNEILTQCLLDGEVFCNWTQIGKLRRKRLSAELPWWLKRYERESTVFDKALELGMAFMNHFLDSKNVAAALGDDGLEDFLISIPILKAYANDVLMNNKIGPILRELTMVISETDDSGNSRVDSGRPSSIKKIYHRLVRENGVMTLKEFPVEEKHTPDLTLNDFKSLEALVDADEKELASMKSTTKSRLTLEEKSCLQEYDSKIWMANRMKLKSVKQMIKPADCQFSAILGTKQFVYPFCRGSNDDKNCYLNKNDERQRNGDLDSITGSKASWGKLPKVRLQNVSSTERKYFETDDEMLPVADNEFEDSTLLDVDTRDWKSFFSK